MGVIKVAGYASAVYGAYETGQAIGEGVHDVATGESTVMEVAGSVAIDVAVNAALGAAGLGVKTCKQSSIRGQLIKYQVSKIVLKVI